MRGASGILIIVIGLVVLWAVVVGAGPCFAGAFACLLKGGARVPATGTNVKVGP